jgi:hypothetical protein
MKKLPIICPACGDKLSIKRLSCDKCQTSIEGDFQLPPLARLGQEDQNFLVEFIKASGSLKEMAAMLGLSYPTVRNMLDEIIRHIKENETKQKLQGETK